MVEDAEEQALRFGELKGRVDHFISTITDLRSEIEKRFDSLSRNFDDVNKTIIERSKPQWMVMTSFASIILVVVGAIGEMALTPLRTDLERVFHERSTEVPKVIEDEIRLIDEKKLDRAIMEKTIAELNSKIEDLKELKTRLKR